jgi:hypothetical protein
MRGNKVGGPIRWKMHFPIEPKKIYQALDSDEGRACFWAESAIEQDGFIEFNFANGYFHKGKILKRKADKVWSVDYFGGPVTFELSSDGKGGTDLLMTHEGVSEGDWYEVHAGWLNVLFPMKAWLVHGVDLRNHDPSRSWDHGYADQ